MSRDFEYISFAELRDPITVPQVDTREFYSVRHAKMSVFYAFLCSHEISQEPLMLFLQQVKHKKEAVRDYIMTLPKSEKEAAAKKIVNFATEWSVLGEFFWLKRGRLEPSLSTGTLRSFTDVMFIAEYQGLCALDIKALYDVICNQSLPVVALELLHRDPKKKEQMRDHIMTLSWEDKVCAVRKILHFQEEPSTLGGFFWLKRGVREPSLQSGTLKVFADFFAGTGVYSSKNRQVFFHESRDSDAESLLDASVVVPALSMTKTDL